jgi:hypothetical protein
MTALAALILVIPMGTDAGSAYSHALGTSVPATIAFGQELGNIRPFRVTITGNGTIQLNSPIHLSGAPRTVSKDAVAGLVLLATVEGFRSLPSFTACPGVLPDIAARYVNIRTPAWKHRASVRGNCLDGMNQLFAVIMDATHASY